VLSEQGSGIAVPDDFDDLNAEQAEELEEELIDQATAAQTVVELEAETAILEGLVEQAGRCATPVRIANGRSCRGCCRTSECDRRPGAAQTGHFSEHRDAQYLTERSAAAWERRGGGDDSRRDEARGSAKNQVVPQ
jgi:hypothetical protein